VDQGGERKKRLKNFIYKVGGRPNGKVGLTTSRDVRGREKRKGRKRTNDEDATVETGTQSPGPRRHYLLLSKLLW